MSDEIIPPPLPAFAAAKDETTQPGLGMSRETIALRQENARLRSERNEALASVPDTLPPPTRKQRTVAAVLAGSKYALILPVLAFTGRALARKYPQLQDLIDAVLQGLGL